MSFTLNYDSLVARVVDDLERNDAVVQSSMDSWIKMAHQRIGRDCGSLLFDRYVTDSFTPGQPYLNKPSRWQNTLAFRIGTGENLTVSKQLLLRSYEWCREYTPDGTYQAEPKYFADYGYNSWLISPTPDAAYPYEIAYMETPQVIDETYQTNYLTENMPEILIRAVLWEAMLTLKNDERLAIIQNEYTPLVASWNAKDTLLKTDRYTNRGAD